jgi:hypothetical protein
MFMAAPEQDSQYRNERLGADEALGRPVLRNNDHMMGIILAHDRSDLAKRLVLIHEEGVGLHDVLHNL